MSFLNSDERRTVCVFLWLLPFGNLSSSPRSRRLAIFTARQQNRPATASCSLQPVPRLVSGQTNFQMIRSPRLSVSRTSRDLDYGEPPESTPVHMSFCRVTYHVAPTGFFVNRMFR